MMTMTTTQTLAAMFGKPCGSLYPADVAKRVMVSVQDLRSSIGKIAAAMNGGEHLVVTYRGKVIGFISPPDWYRQAAEKMKDPTEY
jgi:hypothetical protein